MRNMDNKEVFEYRELTAEEIEILEEIGSPSNSLRVGPKGYLVPPVFKTIAADIYNMPLRPSDVFVTSYQRSGTTLTQELVWLIANDLDYKTAAEVALVQRYPFLEIIIYLDAKIDTEEHSMNPEALKIMNQLATPATKTLAETASQRFVKSHLPISLLPQNVVDKSKIVYVARDPRDMIVSSFHHARLFKTSAFNGEFKQMWKLFMKDLYTLTPYFEHVKEAWALRKHPNMLFLFYEDLITDMPGSIRRVAKFFDKELNEEQVARLCDHLSIDNCKKNLALNLEDMRSSGILDKNETFIRKGKAGGWREYFDEDMTREADSWIAENLRDSDLRFPSIGNK